MRFLSVLLLCILVAACGSNPKKTAGEGYYRVARGDTLTKIARQHGQSVNEIMRANKIRNPNQIKVGQLLRVKGGTASSNSSMTADAGSSTVQPTRQTTAKSVPAPRRISLVWPTAGSHRKGTGSHSQGVFIQGSEGQPIKAAAAGKVMYAGNGLRGYGNMVIISHDANFISVYAHNKSLNVKEGQSVKQGQTIATMGSTDTTATQLYFELRFNGKAVDVIPHLPSK
ncbi:peptidoglycan DD-metalloendopeptidase family protein [Paenalcaligenes hominis]|uniref:peptidoglycan DD-metalloendopeptidase family protein n=1 Tax=Paenalcaligenes hominis TaxID=643674 RepID=UPI003526A3FF